MVQSLGTEVLKGWTLGVTISKAFLDGEVAAQSKSARSVRLQLGLNQRRQNDKT